MSSNPAPTTNAKKCLAIKASLNGTPFRYKRVIMYKRLVT